MKRSESFKICQKYMGREVVIRTTHGTYKGKIVKLDNNKVYLQPLRPSNKAQISFFPFIIPLVLFDLLAIGLLASRPFFPFRPF
ncbi:hypothetical protein ACFPES_13775 [Paenibacillus sp. GCM10023248]|uniref:hypothetical protein n=1 Tax=Bacillales TaxID=1385 RepID=UPI002378276C|nr:MULTISPECIES: hypothetical protein [Bacillales]MDD9268103.1 hypothetical protein [Paenibacillus sp. MAHUQ-63]MDR6879779.1 hypothetical protein [Bacillus sp. 3255]